MKKSVATIVGVLIFGFTGLLHADVIGNKASKFFFPSDCSYAKLIKPDNQVVFSSAKEAITAGYKYSTKCKPAVANDIAFVGNKISKLFFPTDCSYVSLIKEENKVNFMTAADAKAAGYKASSKCSNK